MDNSLEKFFSVCGVTENSQKQHYTGLIASYINNETRKIELEDFSKPKKNIGHIPLNGFIDEDMLDKVFIKILRFFGIPPSEVNYMQTAYKPLNTISETVTLILYLPSNIDEQTGRDVLMLLKYSLYQPKK